MSHITVSLRMELLPAQDPCRSQYQRAIPAKPKLVPPEFRIPSLRHDFENMKEMLYGRVPSFDEVMERIAHVEEEIHELPYISSR